jgi:signal transduction histidine kinase
MATAKPDPSVTIDLPTRPAEQCRVLVVDDDERIVEALSVILSRDGYQISTASGGKEALRQIERVQPDVVVLDVIMPDMDGIAVCRSIKQSPATRFVPVILVTGLGERSRRLEGLNARANDFLDKPVDPLELLARVRSLMRMKQLYDEVEQNRRDLEIRVAERTNELRQANRRLEELSQVKSRILAIVAHELRTPLSRASLALGLIRQDGFPEARKASLLDEISEAVITLEARLDDVRIFSDPLDLKLTPASVADLVSGAIERVRRLRRRSQDLITIDVPAALPPVMVDTTRMSRAMAHIIDNALKFGEGQPVLVQAAQVEGGIKILVRDSGPGIDSDLKPVLFTPLQPGDDSSTRRHGGMGIGLSLVKVILDAHQVAIEFDSQPGAGTAFHFVLPLAELHPPHA